jgi:hypothetical protein
MLSLRRAHSAFALCCLAAPFCTLYAFAEDDTHAQAIPQQALVSQPLPAQPGKDAEPPANTHVLSGTVVDPSGASI